MVTHAVLTLPAVLTIGQSTIRLDQDDALTLAFLNGYTAGHLSYMVHGKQAHLFDTDLILLIVSRQKTLRVPLAFNVGFLVGYLATQTQKNGVYTLTHPAFGEGLQQGLQDYCLAGQRAPLTLSDLCCLVSWHHRGADSAYNAGYVAGFIQGMTQGLHAILAMVKGAK
jgi:hypothetical protein